MFATKKKIFISFLLILPLIALSMTTVDASPEIIVDIETPTPAEVMIGTQIAFNVTITAAEESHDLVGVEFQITWNTTLLQGISMDLPEGHFFEPAEDDTNMWVIKKTVNDPLHPDTAWYLVTCSDLQRGYDQGYLPLIGSGVLATITLEAYSLEGVSDLSFEVAKLSNGDGEPITDFTEVDGAITVIPEYSNFIILMFLALSFAIAIMYKRLSKGSNSALKFKA